MSAYLISLLSKTVYSTLKTLCLPASPGSMKFSELTTLLSQHFRIKTSRTTATFLFRQCSQGPTETVTEFAHKLKNKSVDCDFDAFLDRALRDQFIAGLRDIGLKKTILTKPDADVKTFQNVQEIALAEEAATRFANQMSISAATASTSTDPTQVHHASSTSTKKSWQTKKKQFSRPPTTQRLCYQASVHCQTCTPFTVAVFIIIILNKFEEGGIIMQTYSKAVLAFRHETFRSITRQMTIWKYEHKLGRVNVFNLTVVLKSKEYSYT